jgi:2-polyprenyl-3-methyl-5-hydroxy-6-metoxy-1,4-benzoquinol methylase
MTLRLPPLDARIPAWNLDDLVARPCPYCDAVAREEYCIRPDGLTVRECRRCGAFFVSPAPTEAQLARFYSNYDSTHRRDAAETPADLRVVYQNHGPLEDFVVRELSSMMAFKGKRVLDVGFGRAHFLWSLQSLGANVHGVELDDGAISIARGLGITNVRKGTIEQCTTDQPYDLIALNELVEHPLEPLKLLRGCVDLLAPGGLLPIRTPNGAVARGATDPVTFRVDLEHMQYLTPEACSMMAGVLGLQIAHLETYGYPYLEKIDQPRSPNGRSSAVRWAARSMPVLARTVRRFREWTAPDERLGAYHLLCVYQKPRQRFAEAAAAERADRMHQSSAG